MTDEKSKANKSLEAKLAGLEMFIGLLLVKLLHPTHQLTIKIVKLSNGTPMNEKNMQVQLQKLC